MAKVGIRVFGEYSNSSAFRSLTPICISGLFLLLGFYKRKNTFKEFIDAPVVTYLTKLNARYYLE